MGKHVPPGQEVAVIREWIAEARRAAGELYAAIKEAKELKATLVTDFERIHAEEIMQLSNFLADEANRHAAAINADIEAAQAMIREQIMAGEAVFDRNTMTVTIKFGGGRFDDQQPLPYPEVAPKETQQ